MIFSTTIKTSSRIKECELLNYFQNKIDVLIQTIVVLSLRSAHIVLLMVESTYIVEMLYLIYFES